MQGTVKYYTSTKLLFLVLGFEDSGLLLLGFFYILSHLRKSDNTNWLGQKGGGKLKLVLIKA